MLKKTSILVILVAGCLAATAHAVEVEVAGGGWQQDLSGTLSYQALSSNDLIDLEENLNFDEETAVFGRIKIETPAFVPNIYLVGAPGEMEGAGSKTVAVKFGDTTFNANTALKAKIRAVQYDIGIYYGLPFVENGTGGMLSLDLGLNVRIADFEAEITGTSGATTVTETESILLPVPMLYMALKFAPIDLLLSYPADRPVRYHGQVIRRIMPGIDLIITL